MSWHSKLFGGKQPRPKFTDHVGNEVRFKEVEPRHQGAVQYYYEIYIAKDKQAAMRFLARVPQADIEPRYYVVVETPEGEFGKDVDGIYQDDNI